MNILVTGANGFVGKNLISYLKNLGKGNIPFPLNRDILSGSVSDNLSFIKDNKIHSIIHLAGKAHDLKKTVNPEEYYMINYGLTKKIFDAFLASEASVFIFVSSVKAVADHTPEILTETTIPAPFTDYGKSKLAAEKYILETPLPSSKRVYVLRPCMIHGPGNKGNLNLLYKFVEKGIPYPLGAFNNKRSYLSVENLCFVIYELINRPDITNGIYNVCDNEPLSTNEVVAIIATSIGRKHKRWNLPLFFIKYFAKLGDVLNLPFNTERLGKLTESYTVSNKKIINEISKPLPVSSRDGLAATIRSFTHAD